MHINCNKQHPPKQTTITVCCQKTVPPQTNNNNSMLPIAIGCAYQLQQTGPPPTHTQQQQYATNNNRLCIPTTALSVTFLISDRHFSRHSGGSVHRQHPAGPTSPHGALTTAYSMHSLQHTACSIQLQHTACSIQRTACSMLLIGD